MNYRKYKRFKTIRLHNRTWPDQDIVKAPKWCSVDLRDGNQSLRKPLNIEEKLLYFDMLVKMGFDEIEVGYPASSNVEFEFVRKLIEEDLIPDNVTIQVFTQAREDLIYKTFQAIKGAKKVIFNIYNSISLIQREVVFEKSKDEIRNIVVDGVKCVKKHASLFQGEITLEYTVESFTGTEIEYAIDICKAVYEAWEEPGIIINLPSTVEMDLPCVYADQIEYFCKNYKYRKQVILSCHPHNDRGTGVSAAECAILAGVERIEGTLFGNGERTGNVDLINLALNMVVHGINPGLKLDNISKIMGVYEKCFKQKINQRHPYVGSMVYSTFAGSHQFAIAKSIEGDMNEGVWNVPYIPLDPNDIGIKANLIRINSQSGRAGIKYLLQKNGIKHITDERLVDFFIYVKNESERIGEISEQKLVEMYRYMYNI